jgi:hypothetical protein
MMPVRNNFSFCVTSSCCLKQRFRYVFFLCSVLFGFHSMKPLLVYGSSSTQPYEVGLTTQKVVALDKASFKVAISDPANAFWFLKFFAPWYVLCEEIRWIHGFTGKPPVSYR